MAVLTLLTALALLASAGGASAAPEWTTYRHDAARSGIDPEGTSPAPPARVWQTVPLDGDIYGEPLVLGSRVYVATENDTIYSLDAGSGSVVWAAHLGTPVPSGELPCGDIDPSVGITSTPVIDPATSTIYAVEDTWDGSHRESIRHRVVALDLSTGAMRPNFPLEADPPLPAGGSVRNQLQRTGLALDAGNVLIGYGGNNGDCETYWGWLVGAPESGAGPLLHYQVDSHTGHDEGAIWGSGNAPAIDPSGDVYVATGNGSSGSEYDYGDSVLKLTPGLGLLEAWAPAEWHALDESDQDLGSSEPALLPGGLLFEIGKQGVGVLLAENALGGVGGTPVATLDICGGSWGGAIYVPSTTATGTLYVTCSDGLHAVTVTGLGTPVPKMESAAAWQVNGNAVGPPILSGGLVWVASYTTGTLFGLDPSTGATRFEESLGEVMHFETPSAGGGGLFVANGNRVTALRVATGAAAPASPIGAPLSHTAPSISHLRQSHARWREGRALARIASVSGRAGMAPRRARGRHTHRTAVGTTFSFALNEAASVHFDFTRALPGRRVGRRCVALGRKRHRALPRRSRCTRTVTVAALALAGRAGRNTVRFGGRISRRRRLRTGSYTALVVASNASGRSGVHRLRFTILAR